MPAYGYTPDDLKRIDAGEPYDPDAHAFRWTCDACGEACRGEPAVVIPPFTPGGAAYRICRECDEDFAGV